MTGMSAGRIAWPMTRKGRGRPAFILCGDLAKAVRRESATAVCHWWGVTPQTVTKWRKALDVDVMTEGTTRLKRDVFLEAVPQEVWAESRKLGNSPEANVKKSASHKGKPIHPNALAVLKARKGRRASEETRRKISEGVRRSGIRPPKGERVWTSEEVALLGVLPDAEEDPMNQPRSLARRLRWPLLSLGLLVILAGLAGWLLLPSDPIGPQAFERIQLGMTEEDVAAVIGLPPGSYVSDRFAGTYELCQYYAPVAAEKGRPFPEARWLKSRDWCGDDYWIKVMFDEDQQAVGIYLHEIHAFAPSHLDRFRTWLGL